MCWNLKEAVYLALCLHVTVSFRLGDTRLEHADHFVEGFTEEQPSSLKSIMFYDVGRDCHQKIHDYRCRAFYPDSIACSLKQVSVNIQDIELFGSCFGSDDLMDGEDDDDDAYVRHVAEWIGGMERLILWDETGSGYAGDKPNETKLIERAIVKALKDGVEQNGYTCLKAIYLEEIEHRAPILEYIYTGGHTIRVPVSREPRTEFCFQDAIAAGKKNSVDVHTLTNPESNFA